MNVEQFDGAYRAFSRRRPFRTFLIEFTSGHQVSISHPESVRFEADLYVLRNPDSGYVIFDAEKVTRLLDLPLATAK